MIYLYNSNIKFTKQIEYTFMNIFYILGLDYSNLKCNFDNIFNQNDVLILYANENLGNHFIGKFKNIIKINPSNKLFSQDYLKMNSIPKKIRKYNDIISIFSEDKNLYISENSEHLENIETNIDIISDIFFMLTRYEEVVNTKAYEQDKYNRFPAKESIAFKNDFLDRPIVNEHIDLLWGFIDSFNLGYKKKKWWGEKDFVACLTHDVDHIQTFKNFKEILYLTGSLTLKHRKLNKAIDKMSLYIKYKINYRKDPIWTFDYIISLEKSYNYKSSFYFMNDKRSKGNRYSIHDKKIRKLIKQLEIDKFEVGYHGSLDSFDDIQIMKKEKNGLDNILNCEYGCRQHYLRFQVPYTWRYQEKAELIYDTTLSFADAEGFRCGTCFPFKPYDLLENRIIDIWEIPLIVMEGTLQGKNYRAYTPKQGLEETKKLIDTVKKHNGVFTLLYHNSSFDYTRKDWDGWKGTYEETMKYLYENNCLGTSGKEIISIITK